MTIDFAHTLLASLSNPVEYNSTFVTPQLTGDFAFAPNSFQTIQGEFINEPEESPQPNDEDPNDKDPDNDHTQQDTPQPSQTPQTPTKTNNNSNYVPIWVWIFLVIVLSIFLCTCTTDIQTHTRPNIIIIKNIPSTRKQNKKTNTGKFQTTRQGKTKAQMYEMIDTQV